MQTKTIVLAIWLLCCATQSLAAIYKCESSDGTVQFSDTPCDTKFKSFKPLPPANSKQAAPRNERREKLLRAYQDERRLEQQQMAAETAERNDRKMKCSHARNRLQLINEAGRIYNTSDDGSRVVQSDEARAATVRQAEDYVAHWCD